MLDRRIRLRHVRCFLEIARQGSLVRAADSLALSQPAVTKSLQELEQILNATLFERSRKGASLTRFGQAFLSRAAAAMVELEGAVQAISQVRMRTAWTVRVGALPSVAARLMPDALRRFKQTEPEAVVQIVTGPNILLLEQLRKDELDLVVGRLGEPGLMTNLTFTQLYSEPVRLVVRSEHPLLDEDRVNFSKIPEYLVIVPDRDAVIRPSVDRLLLSMGLDPLPYRIESVSTSFGRSYTYQTDAVWIISHGVISRDLEAGTLVALDIDTSDTSGPVGLTARADAPSYPGIETLKTAIRQTAASYQ